MTATLVNNPRDYGLEVALGNVAGVSKVNKFGQALDCDSAVPTDIWDGADGATSTDVWIAPTTARLHDLASASANDAAAGTGMQTCKVYGLTGWGAAEVSETVILNGASNVATANAYVIVHRIKGVTFGSGGTNAGIITATAQTDATVTAAVQAGEGQTLMAIYGVPSTQTLHLKTLYTTILGNSNANINIALLAKENADQSDAGFITKHRWVDRRDSFFNYIYGVPKSFTGPCIIKVQALSDTNGAIVTAGFDAYLVDNQMFKQTWFEADFGANYTSIATVGYRLYKNDNTDSVARTTTGVVDLGNGAYGVPTVDVPDDAVGIEWDTGTSQPAYAREDISPHRYRMMVFTATMGNVTVAGNDRSIQFFDTDGVTEIHSVSVSADERDRAIT